MSLGEPCHIFTTAVANLDAVFVEDLVLVGCFGEMLPDQAEELLSNVRFDVLTKWWCEPGDLASSLPLFLLRPGLLWRWRRWFQQTARWSHAR